MQLTNQKRLLPRSWMASTRVDQLRLHRHGRSAVQTEDIREFIDQGIIKAKPVKGTVPVLVFALNRSARAAARVRGSVSTANARNPRKNRWTWTIRAQRRVLKEPHRWKPSTPPATVTTT